MADDDPNSALFQISWASSYCIRKLPGDRNTEIQFEYFMSSLFEGKGQKRIALYKMNRELFPILLPQALSKQSCQKAISKREALCCSLLSPDSVTDICSPVMSLLWHWLQDFPKEGRWRHYASGKSNRKKH